MIVYYYEIRKLLLLAIMLFIYYRIYATIISVYSYQLNMKKISSNNHTNILNSNAYIYLIFISMIYYHLHPFHGYLNTQIFYSIY